jgi:hypothetical protein
MTINEMRVHRDLYAQDRYRASYYWELQLPSGIVFREFTPDGADVRLSDVTSEPPYQLWARPYRPAQLPTSSIMIEPGGIAVWEHRCTWYPMQHTETEALIFGQLRPMGERTEICRIEYTGDCSVFTGEDGEAVIQRARNKQ